MLFCYKYVRVLYIKLIQYDGDSFHLSKGRNVHGFIIKKKMKSKGNRNHYYLINVKSYDEGNY